MKSGRMLRIKKNQILHSERMNSEAKPIYCSLCPKTFKTNVGLQRSISSHIDENQCKIYKIEFRNISSLKAHKGDDKTFQCKYCNKKFTQKKNLNIHLKIHTGQGLIKCTTCTKQFKTNSNLKQHMIIHTKETKVICTICKYSAQSKSILKRHTIRVHSDESPYKCKKCGKQFGCKWDLKYHMRIHNGDFGFLLKIEDVGDLVNNLRVKYGSGFCDSDGWNPIQIEDTPQLIKHIKIKSTTKPFHCTKCGNLSATKQNLIMHMKIHASLKEFKCDDCGKEFRHKHNLICHIRTHTGERPFKCPLCTKTFTQISNMKVHLNRSHIKEKHWKCEVCDVDFTSNDALCRHKNSKKCAEAHMNIKSS